MLLLNEIQSGTNKLNWNKPKYFPFSYCFSRLFNRSPYYSNNLETSYSYLHNKNVERITKTKVFLGVNRVNVYNKMWFVMVDSTAMMDRMRVVVVQMRVINEKIHVLKIAIVRPLDRLVHAISVFNLKAMVSLASTRMNVNTNLQFAANYVTIQKVVINATAMMVFS